MSRSCVTTGELWCVVWCRDEEADHYDCQPCDTELDHGWTVYCSGLSSRSQAERVVARLQRLMDMEQA